MVRGLARREKRLPGRLGVDEASFQKRHEYVTVVVDQEAGTVVHVADGRGRETLDTFFDAFSWEERAQEDLLGEAGSLSFFTPEAFRFFLPAFIRISLLEPERADLIPDAVLDHLARVDLSEFWGQRKDALLEAVRQRGIPDRMLLDLAPSGQAQAEIDRAGRLAAFTAAQRKSILAFIDFLKKNRSDEFPFGELDQAAQALMKSPQ